MDRNDIDQAAADAKLREMFKRNAPPADEGHLAAALRPSAAPGRDGMVARAPKRAPGGRTLRTVVIAGGAVVLAVAIGMGVWQAAAHLGGDRSVVVITDHPTSAASTDRAQQQMTDGTWELRVDRQADLQGVNLPSDELPENAYHQIPDGPTFTAVISADAAKISLMSDPGESGLSAQGTRKSTGEGRYWYDLSGMTGGRFVVWRDGDGLQAELTLYGSGLPIVLSYRGTFVRVAEAGSFQDVWAASVAAVSAMGQTRVTMTQTVTGGTPGAGDGASASGNGASVTTAEELLDPAAARARLIVHTTDGHVITRTRNGLDLLTVDVDPASSAKAPADRVVTQAVPAGLPLPLWMGGDGTDPSGYQWLVSGAARANERVVTQTDGGKQLSWQQAWDQEAGTDSFTLTLGRDLLPMRIDITSQGTLAGSRIERTTRIEYQIESGASFADSDFSVELPAYAEESSRTSDSPTTQAGG